MPRKAKPTQPARTIPGQTYGVGAAQEKAMTVVPLENAPAAREQSLATVAPGAPPSPPQGAAAASPAAAAPPADFQAALAAARAMAPPAGEINRPGGQMPGISPQIEVWTQLARVTGDPSFLRIAQQARLAK